MPAKKKFLKPFQKKKARKKRRYYAWWVISIALGILVVAGLLAWGSGQDQVTIQTVLVTGNSSVPSEDIRRVAGERMDGRYGYLFARDNIFIYPKEAMVQTLLATFPRLREVRISSDSLTSIRIDVSERAGVFLWCGDEIPENEQYLLEDCYFMDDTGFIFAKAPYFSDNVFFEWFGKVQENEPEGVQFIPQEEFSALKTFKRGVEALGFAPMRIAIGTSTPRYTLYTSERGHILFDETENMSQLIDTLKSALPQLDTERSLSYIDLRFGNKVFYKYEDES